MAALTVRMIEAIKPRDKPFKVTIDRGVQLRVAPDGRRTLFVRYTVKGYPHERQYNLPREYGDGSGQIKLADAKAEAARIRALARATASTGPSSRPRNCTRPANKDSWR
ncbi:MAG TPA: integrase arm-type DNA-binding domain-containing protein [Burkholderiaceae bacterium]